MARTTAGRTALRLSGTLLIGLVIVGLGVWGVLALWYRGPPGDVGDAALIGGWIGFVAVTLTHAWRRPVQGLLAMGVGFGVLLAWWASIPPRGDRQWAPELAVQFTSVANLADPDRVTLTGVRNFDWRSLEDCDARWETRSYDLGALTSVDLLLTYWAGPAIAHTMVSFGFADGGHLAFSGEIRRDNTETFSEIGRFFKDFELILIAADERDVVRRRTNVQREDVRLYRVAMPPDVMRELFLAYVATGDDLAARPRWYNTVTANCTTVIFEMVRRIVPGLPLDWRLIVSGYLPEYLYGIGALAMRFDLPELQTMARISGPVEAADAEPGFSAAIREGIPALPH